MLYITPTKHQSFVSDQDRAALLKQLIEDVDSGLYCRTGFCDRFLLRDLDTWAESQNKRDHIMVCLPDPVSHGNSLVTFPLRYYLGYTLLAQSEEAAALNAAQ